MEENGIKHVTFSTADGALEAAPAVSEITLFNIYANTRLITVYPIEIQFFNEIICTIALDHSARLLSLTFVVCLEVYFSILNLEIAYSGKIFVAAQVA